jgi:hypothetical protein
MADLLIKHLEKKGTEHSALKLLVNQWGFDQQLIPKALQGIGILFPHYSRHDESHSKQILINIERLLGDNISLLTATDTWLILEAAYWHDIGMVVPQQDIEQALRSDGFEQYVLSIRENPHHELHSFCRNFDSSNISLCFSGASSPIDALDQFRQLMAEWFRRKHPERAQAIVQSPWNTTGISSPRTELIPARLFKLLGQICRMHGAPFDALISKGGLPFREAGLAQEDCHPRFVACLLRMGDLLDLDDNRFCPVMQRIAGEDRPQLSKAHEDKHAGIRRLRVDREYIEIDAECETIEGYLECFKWFDWLKKEIQDQMANWQHIVPSRALGLLPTLGPVSVRLNGKYQVLSEGERPQFGIDHDKVKELLQGSNLYSDEFACIRELLQNAVDATVLRVWLANQNRLDGEAWTRPWTSDVISAMRAHPIKVRLTEEQSNLDEKSRWIITISDEGTGISRFDLVHMLNIGGSHNNSQRQAAIASMPEWMKPSGTFGIGFQSAFLICDEITVVTKSVFTNQTLQLKFYSPTKEKEGLVLLQSIEDPFRSAGTELRLELTLDSFAKSYSISFRNRETNAERIARSLDPILDNLFPFKAAQILDRIEKFATYSLVPISAELKTLDGKNDILLSPESLTDADQASWIVLKVDSTELRLRYHVSENYSPNCKVIGRYRGQEFKVNGVALPYISLHVDLMSGKAGSWLTASRDALAAKAVDTFRDIALRALEQIMENRLSMSFKESYEGERAHLSLFLVSMASRFSGKWELLAEKLDGEWLELNGLYGSLKSIYDKDSVVVALQYGRPIPIAPEGFYYFSEYEQFALFVQQWGKAPGRSVRVLDASEVLNEEQESPTICYRLCRDGDVCYSDKALEARLAQVASGTDFNRRLTLCFYSDKTWERLFLQPEISSRARPLFYHIRASDDVVMLPFLFKESRHTDSAWVVGEDSLDELCAWVQPRLINKLPVREIRAAYTEMISDIDARMKGSKYAAKWITARGLDVE